MANVFIDYDGTLAEGGVYPGWGAWLPGAVDAVDELLAAEHHVTVYSVRLNRVAFGKEKDPGQYLADRMEMRARLDDRGLYAVDIYEGDKPFYDLLVDDRAMRHPGRPGSWRRLTPAILARLEA